MRNVKKPVSLLLILAMLIGVICVAPFNVFAVTTNYTVSDATELTNALAEISQQNSGSYTITLQDDINYIGGCEISKNTVTIIGDGNTINFSGKTQGIKVLSGAVLNLSNNEGDTLILNGDNHTHNEQTNTSVPDNDNPGLLYILDQASVCNMYSGVTIQNHKGNNYLGGGVSVESGTFNMYGGTIKNCGIDGGSVCYGGGVAVFAGGTFNMSGGTITNCYASSDYSYRNIKSAMGGGVFVSTGSTFTMTDGEISNNTASYGAGVALAKTSTTTYGFIDSSVHLNGGEIKGNISSQLGGGVFVSALYYAYAVPIGTGGTGAGTSGNPGLYTNGVDIKNNSAPSGAGVCVICVDPSIDIKIKNSTITNNNATEDGGGVCIYAYWTQADIDNCVINNNHAEGLGGGICAINNWDRGTRGTLIKDTEIKDNSSGSDGGGVFYDSNGDESDFNYSKIHFTGQNTVQDNKANGILNNVNVLDKDAPIFVDGDLSGSKIGLTDPTLWRDNKADTANDAVSTEYLTSGYKTNNSELFPAYAFTSDHESWYVDYSNVNSNEVRLVRYEKDVNYHINNEDMDDSIYANEIFTPYVTNHEVKEGKVIQEFHNIPQLKDPDGYVFKGWYYDRDSDARPVVFGESYSEGPEYEKYKDIYAHWEKVDKIEQEREIDEKNLPSDMQGEGGKYYYDSFGLFGVQLRPEKWLDENYGTKTPGGLRFATSIGEKLLEDIDALSNKTVNGNKVEYGFVTAKEDTINAAINKINETNPGAINPSTYKLQYKGTDVNGVDTIMDNLTKEERATANNFRYVTNVDCTSAQGYGSNDAIEKDHRNCQKYRIATFVVTYDNNPADSSTNIVARAYMRYYDANGLLRTFYNDYGGTSVYGGCCTNYDTAAGLLPYEPIDYNNQITN